MPVNRRKILMFGGAAAAVTVAGGWSMLATPSLSRASAPWVAAGKGFADPRLNALSYAILAPNPHNRQPWQFTLVGDDIIDITCDLDRRLPDTDPFDRQITIGFGCMVELLRQAAAELGYSAQIDLFPDGPAQPRINSGRIARVRFVDDRPQRDPQFAHAIDRRSTKEAFDGRPVPMDQLRGLGDAVPAGLIYGHSANPDQHALLSDNAWRGWVMEQETPATRRESIDLMRFGNEAVIAEPDGIDMGGAFLSAGNAAGIVTAQTLDDPASYAYKSGGDMYRAMVDSTPHWAWIMTPTNTREEQFNAGIGWIRLNLAAQRMGLSVHPWSHCLQEFPEMADLFNELRQHLAPDGETIQMFARVGYGPKVPASPRWPLEAKLVDV
ncbi:Acg family FMN-binding oxidoreductase [Erythrobacter sp. Alg231-14]|uniref:Acg family FMN-binding oxidoreductase n=1 Tax=Erythrobacter sp. Alg231-14 TaxID=1922225 RepID=UPI000D5564A9